MVDNPKLALDPSSTCIGYCVFRARPEWTIIEAGRIRVAKTMPWMERVESYGADVLHLIGEYEVRSAVIEVPDRSVGARHQGGGSGLAIYGFAAGYIAGLCAARIGAKNVALIPASRWKRREPKERMRARLALEFPAWREQLAKDAGGDMADAIELSRWHCAKKKLEKYY